MFCFKLFSYWLEPKKPISLVLLIKQCKLILRLQYLQSLFVDERNEKDLISKVNGNSEGIFEHLTKELLKLY